MHGAALESFGICTFVPIPKDHNNKMSDSANFRGRPIALSSVFGKVFEAVSYFSPLMNMRIIKYS